MTVKAEVTSNLKGQSAEIIIIEDGNTRKYEKKTLSGGTETIIFTGLDGGENKEYTAKIVPSTSDVTQTAEVDYGAEIEIDPIPHRDTGVENQVRETAQFSNGVGSRELGLGDNALVGGLLTAALNDGEVLADDGYVYSSVQAAQDAASSWIFIGPGTFNEGVTVDTPGLTVKGSGYGTLIDGGTEGDAITVSSSNVTIGAVQLRTAAGSGNGYNGVEVVTGGDSCIIENVRITESDDAGIFISAGADHTISSCYFENIDGRALETSRPRTKITDCIFDSTGFGIRVDSAGDDSVVANCVINGASNNGINIKPSGGDCIVIGNRVTNCGSDGIGVNATNVIVANNRISGCGQNIDDVGTGTVLDSNNTGASN